MPKSRKRSITTASTAAPSTSHNKVTKKVKTAYLHILEGSRNKTIDPLSCIPLTKIRILSRCGVLKLKRLMGGEKDDDQPGIFASTDTPIVVPLMGSMAHFIHEHFESVGFSTDEIVDKLKERETWYGIIDGMHRHKAITELMEERANEWSDFKWYVTILEGGHSLHEYRQLARLQNMKHSDEYYIKPTLYDIFKGLKEEETKLRKERGKEPSGPEIARAFEGSSSFSLSSLSQAANAVKRFSTKLIETLGEIVNQEIPEKGTAVHGVDSEKYKSCTPDQLQTRLDCRVYRNSFNLSSLKSSTAFMREGESNNVEEGIENQCNTLHRLKNISASISYKCVQPEIVTAQLALSKYARIEQDKFFTFHEEQQWPRELEKVRDTLLRDVTLDNEISENKGNEFTLLPFILGRYKALFPSIFTLKERNYRALQSNFDRITTESPEKENDDENVSGNVNLPESEINSDITAPLDLVPMITQEQMEMNLLAENKLDLYDMKWQDYSRSIFSDKDSLFDLVLTDPPYNLPANPSRSGTGYKDFISDDEMRSFSQFCNRALKTGCYALLFTSFQLFPRWVQSFKDSQFKVMPYPFVVMKDQGTIQQRMTIDFPQNCCEFLMIAKSNGTHPNGFIPDFKSLYNNVCTSSKKSFAGVSNLPVTKYKLLNKPSKEPVRVEEKNVDFITELISEFSPINGSVLDPYGGTFTTGIGAYRSKRRAACVERDSHCFRLAKERIIRLLTPVSGQNGPSHEPTDNIIENSSQQTTHATSLVSNGLIQESVESPTTDHLLKPKITFSSEDSFQTAKDTNTEQERSSDLHNPVVPEGVPDPDSVQIQSRHEEGELPEYNEVNADEENASNKGAVVNVGLNLLAGCVQKGE